MDDSQLVRGVQSMGGLLQNICALGHGKAPRSWRASRKVSPSRILHGDVGRAIVGLRGFVDGHHIGVMDAPRRSRFVLKAQKELGIIQQLAVKDLERHGAVAHADLLSQIDRSHASRAQPPDDAETARESRRKLRLSPALSAINRVPSCGQNSISPAYVR